METEHFYVLRVKFQKTQSWKKFQNLIPLRSSGLWTHSSLHPTCHQYPTKITRYRVDLSNVDILWVNDNESVKSFTVFIFNCPMIIHTPNPSTVFAVSAFRTVPQSLVVI